jgi:hypothetical protein
MQILKVASLALFVQALPRRHQQGQQVTNLNSIPEVWEAPQVKFWRECLLAAGAVMKLDPKFVWLCTHHPHPSDLATCPRFWELPPHSLKIARKLIVNHCNSKTGGKWE